MRRTPCRMARALRVSALACGLAGLNAAPGAAGPLGALARPAARGPEAHEDDSWQETTARLAPAKAAPGGVSDADDWLG
jgi:hypothetical protein